MATNDSNLFINVPDAISNSRLATKNNNRVDDLSEMILCLIIDFAGICIDTDFIHWKIYTENHFDQLTTTRV